MFRILKYAIAADIVAAALLIIANVDFFSSYDFEAIAAFAIALIVAVCFWGAFLMQPLWPAAARAACMILLIPAHILTALFVLMMLGHPVRGL